MAKTGGTVQRPPQPTGDSGLPTGEVVPEPPAPTAESVIAEQFSGIQPPQPQPPQAPVQAPPQAPHQQGLVQPGMPPQRGGPIYGGPPIENNGQFVTQQVVPPQVADPNQPQAQPSTLQNLGFVPPQVVVGDVQKTARPQGAPTKIVRVNDDIENMTITDGNRGPRVYNFTAGHRYEVPIDVAIELSRAGKIWPTS